MAETLTYDAGTDTVTTENNLNEDEQSSLVQGEEMEAQEEQLLAGKYKDAQELEAKNLMRFQRKSIQKRKKRQKSKMYQRKRLKTLLIESLKQVRTIN